MVGSDPDAGLWLDVAEFRHLVGTWLSATIIRKWEVCPACLADLAEAVELYSDHFLAGFSLRDTANFDEWQFFEAEELRQTLASALERLVMGYRAQRKHDSAIPYARRRLALDPLHEPAHRQLMELYAVAGQRSAALRQYQECVRILDDELGVEPSEETPGSTSGSWRGRRRPGAIRVLTTTFRPSSRRLWVAGWSWPRSRRVCPIPTAAY